MSWVEYKIRLLLVKIIKDILKIKLIRSIINKLLNKNIKNNKLKALKSYISRKDLESNTLEQKKSISTVMDIVYKYCDFKNENIVLVNIYGTGDSYHLFSQVYSYAIEVRKIKIQNIIILSAKSNYLIGNLFDYLDFMSIECDFTSEEIDILRRFRTDPLNDRIIIPHVNNILNGNRLEKFSQFLGFSDRQLTSYLLSYEYELKKNKVNKNKYAKYNELIEENSILLITKSNSLPSINISFWIKLANKLLSDGYVVYFNNGMQYDKIKDNKFYKKLELDIDILIGISDCFSLIVGAQCGLTNIIIDSAKKNNIIMVNNEMKYIENFSNNLKLKTYWPFYYPEKFNYPANQILTVNYTTEKANKCIELIAQTTELYTNKVGKILRTQPYTVTMSLGEIVDRISILEVKFRKLSGGKKLYSLIELSKLKDMIGMDGLTIDTSFATMYAELEKLNEQAWNTNEIFYSIKDSEELSANDLAEYGRLIANAQKINKKRIDIKNKLTDKYSRGGYFESKSFN